MPDGDPIGPAGRDRPTPGDEELTEGPSRAAALLSTILRGLRDPVIAIFVLAGIFELLAGDPLAQAIMLFLVALALAFDAIRHRRAEQAAAAEIVPSVVRDPGGGADAVLAGPTSSARTPMDLRLTPAALIGGLAFAVIVGGFDRFSWPATIAVYVPAAAGVSISWRGPTREDSEPAKLDPAGAVAWASVFVAFALWELAALLLQPTLTTNSYTHPTLSFLMDPILASHAGRSVALSIWLVFGWFLVER